jgi:MscS family membrane protein
MKVRFDKMYRGLMAALLLTLVWSVWAGAQTPANALAEAPASNTVQHAEKAVPAAALPGARILHEVKHLEAHPLTFELDRIEILRELEFLGEPLWKYLASVIYLLLAYYLAKLIDLVTGVWLKKLASRTETRLDDVLLQLLHGPIKIIALVILLNIGLNLFEWSFSAKVYLSKGLIVVVAASLTYLALKIIELALDMWRQRLAREPDQRFDDQLIAVLRISLKTFVILVAILVTAQNLDVNITAALTSLSIGGLAVGLAAQDTLSNLFGAIAIFVDKPFRVGDQIKVDTVEGTVEAVSLRSTRVRNSDGHLVAVPNKTMGSATVTNVSKRPNIKTVVNLGLARSLPVAAVNRALAVIEEVYRQHPATQDVWVCFNQIGADALNIQITHWWKGTDYRKYLADQQTLNLAVKEKLDAENIALAVPATPAAAPVART